MPVLSLAHIGMYELTPPELVLRAADAGFDAINVPLSSNRPNIPQFPVQGDTPMMRETLARLGDTGLTVSDVTSLWITPTTDPTASLPLFEAAQRLGAKSFVVCGYDPDLGRSADTFARLCEVAAPFDFTLDLEFVPFSEIKTLDQALAVLYHAAQPNCGVLIDCLHISRAGIPGVSIERIKAIDSKYLNLFQLCDAGAQAPPPDGLANEARSHRLPAGQGGLKLREIMENLPADIDVSVEIPLGGEMAKRPPAERARLLNDTAREFLRSIGRSF